MSANSDYDKLSPEEREVRDKADRVREAAEQAGATLYCDRLVDRALYRDLFRQPCRTNGLSNWAMSISPSRSPRALAHAI